MDARAMVGAAGVIVALTAGGAFGHEGDGNDSRLIGAVHFETTCKSEAQPVFDRGMTALHNFYFGEAKRSFQTVLQTDPRCGIAYWALATVSLGNLLASPPTQKTIGEAHELLRNGYETEPGSQRERDYRDALGRL